MPELAASPRVLVSGVDTLELFTLAPVLPAWEVRLREEKRWAEDGGGRVTVDVLGRRFELTAARSRRAPYLLTSDAVALSVNPYAAKGFPTVSAEVRSAFLWQNGPHRAVDRVRVFLGEITGFDKAPPKVTRCDLATDFQGWCPTYADLGRFVARPLDRRAFCHGQDLTGFDFGAGGEVMARLYCKTLEIRLKSPDKRWFEDVWARSPAYRAGEPVWRLEFQLRRAGFRSFKSVTRGQLDTWGDLDTHAGALWRFLTSRWLRIPGQRTNRSRAVLDASWAVLHAEGFTGLKWTGAGDGDLTRLGRSELLTREDTSFGGHLARAVGRAKIRRPGVTGDEAIWDAIRAAESASIAAGHGDLDERGEERAARHQAALATIMDGRDPSLPYFPPAAPPDPPPLDLTPPQVELFKG